MSTLVFCTGGSNKSGIGHLMRCQALAQAAEKQGVKSLFIVNKAAKEFIEQRHDWSSQLVAAAQTEQALACQTMKIAKDNAARAIIVDGYGFSELYLESVSHAAEPLVLLDDIRQHGYHHANIICNPAGEPWQAQYRQASPGATLCLGPKYRLLRDEFADIEPKSMSQRHSLTINMGGSDPAGLTLPILQTLIKVLPEAPFRVVTGPGFDPKLLRELVDFIADSDCAIQHIHNCQHMADLWNNARLAVVAAGGSQFELAACHTPSVLLIVADNQVAASEQAAGQGWCQVVNTTAGFNHGELANMVNALWQDASRLEVMHGAAKTAALTDGAGLLLDAIAKWHEDRVKTPC